MDFVAELARIPPDMTSATPAYDLGWRQYCHEAAHDLALAAQANSVSKALKQRTSQYAKDRRSANTEAGIGSAAAAAMLMLACKSLSKGEIPDLSLRST